MKNFRLLFIMLAAVMFAVSCSKEDASVDDLSAKKATFLSEDRWNEIDFCSIQTHDLIGGQDILMGSVYVGNTADSLYVKYVADEGYVITETHLFVGDVMGEDFPKTKKDNPKIGQFPYAAENFGGSTVVMYSIGLDEIEGDCFDVAAHAVVECADGSCEETAWGAGKLSSEIVIAAKATFNVGIYGDFGYTYGVLFAEDCSWGPNFGYIPLDLNNFVPGSYKMASPYNDLYGYLNTAIVDNNLVITYQGEGEITLRNQYLFVGTVDELYSYFNNTSCPDYVSFPYTAQVVEIPLANLQTGVSVEPSEFEGNRWGYYFDYCVSVCE